MKKINPDRQCQDYFYKIKIKKQKILIYSNRKTAKQIFYCRQKGKETWEDQLQKQIY